MRPPFDFGAQVHQLLAHLLPVLLRCCQLCADFIRRHGKVAQQHSSLDPLLHRQLLILLLTCTAKTTYWPRHHEAKQVTGHHSRTKQNCSAAPELCCRSRVGQNAAGLAYPLCMAQQAVGQHCLCVTDIYRWAVTAGKHLPAAKFYLELQPDSCESPPASCKGWGASCSAQGLCCHPTPAPCDTLGRTTPLSKRTHHQTASHTEACSTPPSTCTDHQTGQHTYACTRSLCTFRIKSHIPYAGMCMYTQTHECKRRQTGR